MFCHKCGSKAVEDANFCARCGTALIKTSVQPAQAQAPQPIQHNNPTPSQKRAEAYCRANQAWFLDKIERFYPLDEQLLTRFEDSWDWKSLSLTLPWTEELIVRYADRLDWYSLSNNKSLPWSEEFIVRLNDMRESKFYELLSKDESNSLCLESWCFESLSQNEAIP